MAFDWTPLPHVTGGALAVLLTVLLYVVAVLVVAGLARPGQFMVGLRRSSRPAVPPKD